MRRMQFCAMSGVLMLLASSSCSTKNSDNGTIFPEVTETAWTVISGDDEILPGGASLGLNDSSIFIVGSLDGKWVHRYGRNDGQLKERIISSGQGPDEIISAMFTPVTMLNDDSVMVISEGSPRSIKMLKIAGAPGVIEQINTSEMARPSNLPHYIDRNRILIESADLSKNPVNRAYVLVKDGEVASTYSDMPEDETAARMLQDFSMNNSMAVSPDGQHIAVAYLYGGTLELFAVEDTVLRNVYSHAFHPMDLPADPVQARQDGLLTRAFNKAQATNEYVFLSYSGENTPESDNKIAIFDWEGNPVKMIQTDCQIVAFAVDDKASEIYAITIPGPDGEKQISKLSYTLP